MITSYYIKNGQALVLSAGNHCHHIESTEQTRPFLDAVYLETEHPVSRCLECKSWIPVDQEARVCKTCSEVTA